MFEHEIAEELHMLTQPYVGTGEGKLIPKTPLRSDDGAEYEPPKEDDGRHFGLRPMLDKLDNVAKIAASLPLRTATATIRAWTGNQIWLSRCAPWGG